MRAEGQALVEAALILPVLLSILLGVAGIFYLDLATRRMQNGVDVLAQLASETGPRADWHARVISENARTGCNASPLEPVLTYPDGKGTPHSRVLLTWSCHLRTNWVFDGLPITVSSEAVLERSNPPEPAPSPRPR